MDTDGVLARLAVTPELRVVRLGYGTSCFLLVALHEDVQHVPCRLLCASTRTGPSRAAEVP